jgi:hypothetical protein
MKSNIATAINAAHAGVEAAKHEGARHAIECGRLLLEAKETVQHGGWDAWVREHCVFSPRTAQLYVKVFRHVEDDPANPQRVADLSLREASQLVAKSRSKSSEPMIDEVDELMRSWLQASPDVRRTAADTLLKEGSLSPSDHAKMINSTREDDNANLFAAWLEARTGLTGVEKTLAFLEGGGDLRRVAKLIRKKSGMPRAVPEGAN